MPKRESKPLNEKQLNHLRKLRRWLVDNEDNSWNFTYKLNSGEITTRKLTGKCVINLINVCLEKKRTNNKRSDILNEMNKHLVNEIRNEI